METSLMRHSKAIAARTANSTALRLSTGKAPGSPRQTGHTFVFGGSPKRVEHEQNIFEAVSNCTWTSSPMTGSYFARRSPETAEGVAISGNYSWTCRWRPGVPAGRTGEDTRRSILKLLGSFRFRRAQVLLHRNFEIHQLLALRVLHSHQIEGGASQRIRNVGDIEKQETTHRGVRFHRLGSELSLIEFVPGLAAHASFNLFLGQRNRQGSVTSVS